MKNRRILTCFVCLVSLTILANVAQAKTEHHATSQPSAAAQDAGNPQASSDKPKYTFRGDQAMMVRELKLTEEQQDKLHALVEEQEAAMAAWEKQNKPKMEELEKQLKVASQSSDKSEAEKLKAELKDLRGARAKIRAEYTEKMTGLLTPQQKTDWDAFKLYRQNMRVFRAANLTDDQKKAIRALCAEASKSMPAEKDKLEVLKHDLTQKINKTVLTDAQRETLTGGASGEAKTTASQPAEHPRHNK